jgi:hypothetical protein
MIAKRSTRPAAARLAAAFAIALLAAASAGCRSGTDTGTPPVNLGGQWRYTGEQLAPVRAGLNGTLSVDHQSGRQLDGSLTVTESSAGGSRALSGFVNGRIPDVATIEFQVELGGGARVHQGQIRGDSIVGTWYDEFAGGGSGSFRCAR